MALSAKLNIVADENMAAVAEYFGDIGDVRLVSGRELQQTDLCEADVLLVRSVTRVDKKLLDGTSVRFVGTATSGFDHVDINYLAEHNIGFAHAPGSNANSVVEYVLGAIGAVDKKLEQLFDGGTLGIIGYGNIGCLLATRLSALGIAHKIYDPWIPASEVPHVSSLTEVLACDVISLHAELTKKAPWPSYHLLGEEELAQINADALLINASRGAVIDNSALRECLESGTGPVTILDVWEEEPQVPQALLSLVEYGSAHIAGYSLDGKLLATRMLKDALLKSLQSATQISIAEIEEGTAVPLTLPEGLSGAALLRSLLNQNYQVAEDDRLLRKAVVGKTNAEVAANFDCLRKTYRARREVSGAAVETSINKEQDLRILKAMGCWQPARLSREG